MNQLVNKCVIKFAIGILICILISTILTVFMPHFSNDVALEQLENSDTSFTLMNIWYQIQNYTPILYCIIIGICVGSVSKDISNYISMKDEEIH